MLLEQIQIGRVGGHRIAQGSANLCDRELGIGQQGIGFVQSNLIDPLLPLLA